MSMTEKTSLINEVTLNFVEKFKLSISEVKSEITNILKNYHVTISNEDIENNNFETEYLMKKFLDNKAAINASILSKKQYLIAVEKHEKYTGKKFAENETEDIRNFLKAYSKEVKSITVRAKYNLLSSVYGWLYNNHLIVTNPMIGVDTPKVQLTYKEAMTDLDLEKIKFVCENMPEKEYLRNMAIIEFFTTTGCRVSELCHVKIGDINLEEGVIKILGKGNKERPVPLIETAKFRILEYLKTRKIKNENSPLFAHIRGSDEKEISKDGVERIIKKIRKSANLKTVTCHTFRRYNATMLSSRNVPDVVIGSHLGHANGNQIAHYIRFNDKSKITKIKTALCVQ